MATITYSADGKAFHTLPLGAQGVVMREGACDDIALCRAVAVDCPLVVTILIRTTGEIVLWMTEWREANSNTYWHFAAGTDATHPLTTEQRTTLAQMWLGTITLPGDLRGALGQPVAAWAFAGSTPDQVAARHGVPRPILNG